MNQSPADAIARSKLSDYSMKPMSPAMQDRRTLAIEIERLKGLLSGRAGKLLKKGKPFIVIADDETYFTTVYKTIREMETANGRWTEECERCFQELTNEDENARSYFPVPTPEFHAVVREAREKVKMQAEIKRLRDGIEHVLKRAIELDRANAGVSDLRVIQAELRLLIH